MEKDPHQLIEGIMIACHAIRSSNAYLYLRYEYGAVIEFWMRRSANATRPGCWARTFWAPALIWTWCCIAVPVRTSAAKRPG